jgi:hypothetical protein
MADNTNPNGGKTSSAELLPKYYRTDANKKFLQATVDQLIQPGTVKKVNGYVGRKNSKSTTGEDIFVQAPTNNRQNYQLEPGLVIKDSLDNTTFFKDYQDYINQLNVFGANVKNHQRLNEQEFYSWDPHIDWDKFVNFQQYYWLPYGPDVIKILGIQENVTSTYRVEIKTEADNNTYVFYPNGLVENPSIRLYRGQTYRFEINSPGNPFSIKTARTTGSANRYEISNVSGHAVEQGVIEFVVPTNSPDLLYYVSESDADLGGVFEILSVDENSFLDLTTDIIGKKTFTLPNGTPLSNGMKVSFVGTVIPEEYKTGQYYVEGVGESITLVPESRLELISPYTTPEAVLFDSDPFDTLPFGDSTSFSGKQDYIVINRRSADYNSWTRHNRWFHKSVIEASAAYNGKVADIDQSARAVRPIIEFEPDLKLFNFGTRSIVDVDLIDTYTTDVFSKIEGQLGYNIDGIPVAQGQRILFPADTDIRVKNKIYKVEFLLLDGERRIHLVEQTLPEINDCVLIRQGIDNQGLSYWYDGSTWNKAQQKISLNQAPLFDIFDSGKNSFGDRTVYDGSTFEGTKLFSYKIGSGATDLNLGFALSYKNIDNIGDIVFNFNISSDTFQYKNVSYVIDKKINAGFLLKTLPNGQTKFVNGWQVSQVADVQPAIRIYKDSNKVNNFDIDLFDNINDLADLHVRVYVNGKRLDKTHWSVVDGTYYKKIVLETDIKTTDILTIKAFAKQPINDNGFYEMPIGFQNNPLNEDIVDFTLGEISSHLDSIVDNIQDEFVGLFPGPSNIRDLGNITRYGTRFVQHSGPISLAAYHLTSQNNNIIRAIEASQNDYIRFKRNFIIIAEKLGVDSDPVRQVNLILQEIAKDKPKTSPYYFSDMVPFSGSVRSDLKVFDYRIKTYPLTNTFDSTVLSSKAVLVYLNGEQLLLGKDYTFNDQGFVVISANLENNDNITIYEFENTNGCFVPATPTKLGIWPKYEPKIYLDTSLVTPRLMIQGHDGSQILAYGDFRDDLILELEKRIYNNIKISYDTEIFDINDYLPSYNRNTSYSLTEFNEVLSVHFYSWANLIEQDFTKQINYDNADSRTYNYRDMSTPDGISPLPGYWKGIHRWMLGTDRPNICPWEMLGFSEEPVWWQQVYGPAPYTSNNLILWDDLAKGIVREPNKPLVQNTKYIRPYIEGHIPVNENGELISPLESGLATGVITNSTAGDFVFGDVSPVESAWRRSSHYPYSVLITLLLTNPAKIFGLLLDRSRIVRDLSGQLVYKDTELRIKPANILLPSIYSSTTSVRTSGIINFIVDYIQSDNLKSYDQYVYDLNNLQIKLSYRIGGFTSKEKFKLLLDSKTPLTTGSVFVPQEDYDIVLNSSTPIKKITYSGVIITKLADGFIVKGYNKTQPYFKYYSFTKTGILINVGGISESYTNWTTNSQYSAGKVVAFNNRYYRVKTLHTTDTAFNPVYYTALPTLPIIGGRDAYFRQDWDRTEELVVPYGTKFKTIQDVVDFLLGYGEYLKDQGFIFDNFNPALGAITNWETSAKEFLFWTTQNWSTGEDKWVDWTANQPVALGEIVRYNGDYYRAINSLEPASVFNTDDYVKLDGLSSIGSSVISLSPAASNLTFTSPLAVVDDIRNPFNGYEIFKVDGSPIPPTFLNNYRDENAVSYTPLQDGIYGAVFYLVQKEQVVILKNSTLFNDTIYSPTSGFRQERIKIAGYVSSNWKGNFNVPGFIFDQATIQEWEAWKDYSLGDIVKYKQFYYTAKEFISGDGSFVSSQWMKLDSKPSSQLLPNWSYKASQFSDFYSLDSDNFDASQQAVAQHLIGYQKRQYLSNIIQDDVSEFKFYQGMIVEKGTKNVLNKLFDVLSADGQESVKFFEEWAVRVGQYGASGSFENIEFIVDEQYVKNNPQGFELVKEHDDSVVDFILRQTPNDVYLKPIGYNSNPWPISSNKNLYLRTPGYVRSGDVKLTLKTFEEILTQDITSFVEGNCVWVGFEGREWNVYKYTRFNSTVLNIEYKQNKLILTLADDVLIDLGTYLGIDQAFAYNGFYKIDSIQGRVITLAAILTDQPKVFAEQDRVVLSYFTSVRSASMDESDKTISFPINDNDLIWTDDSGDGKWAVWQHQNIYSKNEIVNTAPSNGLFYGRQLLLNPPSTISIITTNQGDAIVYDKAGPYAPWLQRQTITAPFISTSTGFGYSDTADSLTGDVIAISADSTWFASATPLASSVCSKYVGVWDSSTTYSVGQIVIHNSVPYVSVSSSTNKNPETISNSYLGMSGTALTGAGVGATFNITTNKANYSATIVSPGDSYAAGDTIRILGASLGGSAPTNNLIIKVTSIAGGALSGPIAAITVSGNAKTYWKPIAYIPVDATGSNSNLDNQGVVSIYKKDNNNIFSLVATILSPLPSNNQQFGTSLVFADNTLFVGANGHNNNTGIVYRLDYKTVVEVSTSYNPTGSAGTTVVLTSTAGIEEGMYLSGTGFTSGQYVAQVNQASNSIIISAEPDATPSGKIEFTTTDWRYNLDNILEIPSLPAFSKYGSVLSISSDNNTLLVSTVGVDRPIQDPPVPGTVFVYKKNLNDYNLAQTIDSDEFGFGTSLTVSNSGEYIAISSILADGTRLDQGKVYVYKNVNDSYQFYQDLYNVKPEVAGFFGTKISFMNNYETLVVFNKGSDNVLKTKFDLGATTFDNNLTRIYDLIEDGGRIDIYDRYASNWVYSESLENTDDLLSGYSIGLAVGSNQVIVGSPNALDQGYKSGKVYEYRKSIGKFSWSIYRKQNDRVDIDKIKRAFLYNKATNKLVSYLDIIDSTQGKIPGIADQEIRFKTFYDPAVYSVGDSTVNVDDGMAWTKQYVGTLWWDLRTAKFLDSHDTDLVYRNSTWNTIFPGASIDIYEWVETKYTPEKWNSLADTEEGVTAGISGTSLYGNDVYSLVRKYDSVAKSFKNTYYFWVKNKKTVPNVLGRLISASDVSTLIENPRGYGYKYIALTSSNSFSLVNVKPLLQDKDVVLSVEYWTSSKTDENIHSEWKIINNNIETSIPPNIEQKWFDSLCGKDSQGRLVPDPALPPKLKYGIENRPRQGIFINRFEALKQFIEHVNNALIKELVVDNSDLSKLEQYETEPSTITGLYDSTSDSELELRFANIGNFEKPQFAPVIENGRIVGIDIINKGKGYVIAPYFTITGSGTGAIIRSVIDVKGQVTGIEIISEGYGYSSDTLVTLRNYSVLVHSDSVANGNWSIYTYEPSTQVWSRVRSQSYDVRNYWNYVDWYATGYNQFTSIDHSIVSMSDLQELECSVGQTVKVRVTTAGTWLLLEKYANSSSIDWTQSYKVVGKEKGTIQFVPELYSFSNSEFGFDGSLYDSGIFDNSASTELRIILETLKNNILVDDMKEVYLNLFFNSVRYAYTEQNYIDWIFKTSFVKAQHSVGELKQKVTYNSDNLENFEDYINEVKPYRTKIREYVSAYNKVDTNQISTTDFDLPPVYENGKLLPITTNVINGMIEADNNQVLTYPWKHWYDNVGFSIISLDIVDGGSGYRAEPVVKIISNTGSGATARAFFTNGKINRVVLLTKGSGYLSAPTVVIDGGLIDGGTPAKVIAKLGNSVVRSNLVKIKFDRITQKYFVNNLQETEEISGSIVSGSKLQFSLKWAPDVRIGKTTVLVGELGRQVEVLRSNYKLATVKSTSKGYTSYSGTITFDVAPKKGSIITITYIKDWSLLNAADRIQYYYDPATGELGKDLAQLMTGVDYGGVNIHGLNFDISSGWGSVPYYTDKWASFDSTFDDYIVTVSAGTYQFTLPYVPADGTEMNVYYVGKNTDSYVGDGYTLIYNFNINDVYPPTATVVIDKLFNNTGSINVAGSDIIKISNTTGIKIGDILTIDPDFPQTVGFETKVVSILDSTRVKLDQILFKNIANGTTAKFTRTLIDPTDCTINPNGTIFLQEPIPTGATLNIEAYVNPVRLDDPNFTVTGAAQQALDDLEQDYAFIISNRNTLINNKNSSEANLENYNAELVSKQAELNALLVILDGLDPSDPLYAPTVSQINILVNTEIPNIQASIEVEQIMLDNINSDLAANTIEKAAKTVEINDAKAYLDSLPPLANLTAIMQTIISDGIPDSELDPTYKTFIIPAAIDVYDGDQFIWRRAGSDGSVLPQDQDYDTALSGGEFLSTALTSATGLAAEDIIVDGDGFVTPTSSPATEEVVPGQIVDAVAIKVYDRPSVGSANIRVDSYVADGIQTDFAITQQPNSPTAVIVKFTNGFRDPLTDVLSSTSTIKTVNDDYIIDYGNKLVKFNTAPTQGELVSIFSFGFNGSNLLDLDYFIGDGSTVEFVTKAPWVEDVNYIVYVNGEPAEPGTPALFKTDSSYESANRIGLYFSVPPSAGALINYVIVSGTEQTYSITKTQRIQGNGSNVYNLEYAVGDKLPAESNMLVRVNNKFLKGPNNSYYTITGNKVNYAIDPIKFLPYSLSANDIYVYAGGKLLTSGIDYTVELSGITVKITQLIRKKYLNQELIISVKQDQEYTYIPSNGVTSAQIQFVKNYVSTDLIEVVSSYKHDILDIQRTGVNVSSNFELTPDTPEFYNYKGVAGGVIQLDRSVIDDNYVWVIKNGLLLTPSADFKLNQDKKSIKLAFYPDPADEFTIITYGSQVLKSGVSYMQFKDMLNRIHFKRLNANKRTILVKDLKYLDTSIEVEDASNFDAPSIANNKPGIIEIRGERIEFFTLQTKVEGTVTTYLLGQLRRGTLGTGVSKIHKAGSFVQDIGVSETIPYVEKSTIEQIKSDGTNIVPLTFVPTKSSDSWTYDTGFTSSIPTGYGQSNDIEVFVGGYSSIPWSNGIIYKVNDIVEVGSYTFRCLADHISGLTFKDSVTTIEFNQDGSYNTLLENVTSSTVWTFFVGNIRLKKQPYKIHNVDNAPDSPEGDVQLDAEFAVDGFSNELRLTHQLTFGTRVTVVKRTGIAWDSTTNILDDDSKIARFLKAVPGVWYTNIGKYENKAGIPSSFDSSTGTFDSASITFDQE